ncbi:tetratricopeptide repeat protein [Streptoalloteichus hindustanus]|uniref:ATP-, maltotriose-and DNA-dependent transcriptional regulator MalT n=1 Tax=Streptoalloteichus hindustanus TaxID=2017 RepID=A0A1M4YDM4_STRHI|nr:tetratricopeptide repeat protein [Streptoalloteichus hindustanus]SHF03693.1 ATP-, maltotriose-and DNA-dependent transcriptional regulator MalT [Streptoalloteichus hindustanus]
MREASGEGDDATLGSTVDNFARARLIGTNVQTGNIQGGFHLHPGTTPPTPPVPRQLPAPPLTFTNRDEELDQLDEWFHHSPTGPLLVVITGIGGIGKTALALRWLSLHRNGLRDGQLFVDLNGFAPVGVAAKPSDVLGGFLRALGVFPENLPATLADRASLYRSLTADSSLAIFLDNARTAAQVRPLLPASPHSIALVTSRWRLGGLALDGARFLDVVPLEDDASVDLLSKAVGARVNQEPDPAQELARLCAGLPIALSLLSARLSDRPGWPLSRVVRELHDERRRLSSLASEDDLSLKAVFDLSYRTLPPELARAARLLALHPGPAFGLEAATALLGTDRDDALHQVTELVRVNLLHEDVPERFRFHDLVRIDAAERAEAEDPVEERDEAHRRVLNWYLERTIAADLVVRPTRVRVGPGYQNARDAEPGFNSRNEALAWLGLERSALFAAVRLATSKGWGSLVWQFCEALWSVFLQYRPYSDWIASHRSAIDAARRERDPLAEARMRCQLAAAYLDLERFGDAEGEGRVALRLAREIGHPPTESTALEQLGVAAWGRGDLPLALDHLRRSVVISEARNQTRAVAMRRRQIGQVLVALDRCEEAVQELTTARDMLVGVGDQLGEARVLTSLGAAHFRAGDTDRATALLERAVAILTEHGTPFFEAEARVELGEVAAATGDLTTAHEHWTTAERYYRRWGNPLAERLRHRMGWETDDVRQDPS